MKRIIAIALMMIMLLGCGALAEGTLNVTGSGTVYVAADRVSASLGISISGEDLAELQNQANEKMNAICFDTFHNGYYTIGERVGTAFSDGKKLK